MRCMSLAVSLFASLSLLTPHPRAADEPAPPPAGTPGWTLVAYNDLGMHCLDSDYSVFSILPPFNSIFAQLIDADGDLVVAEGGITVTYEAQADPTGSINTTSAGKTNYWQFTPGLYGGSSVPDTGLAGHDMPGPANTPQAMEFDPARKAWKAEGIPLTPTDDAGHGRTYPMMRLVARDGHRVLATATPVLPVSSEMDCRACHASGSGAAAEPGAGWTWKPKAEQDYRMNILRLHDELHLGEPDFDAALLTSGIGAAGLEASAQGGRPVLCAACHASNALPGTGLPGISQFTSAVHAAHGPVIDPTNGMTLESSDNRSSCYRCHPGSETRCLRGAMGAAVAGDGELSMQCQDCHGGMSAVGDPGRVGWLEQPNCQACHTGTALQNNGQIRYLSALEPDGSLRVAVDQTFATDADVPAPGFSLYRFSEGHGGLHCSTCHGSTHAEFPALHPNDNIDPASVQGHGGMLVECTACHAGTPNTVSGGPHGMHPVGQPWIEGHKSPADENLAQCRACHGLDDRGTVLSMAQADRALHVEDNMAANGTKTYFDGARVSCYDCHDGPHSESPSPNTPANVQDGAISVGADPVVHTLVASDPNGNPLQYRVVSQPSFGRVGLSGNQATYIPDPGFAGTDSFSWAAWDGSSDSRLATVTVTRLAGWDDYAWGYPGTGGAVPGLDATADPVLGTTTGIDAGNTSGVPAVTYLFLDLEPARIDTKFGGVLLNELGFGAVFVLPAGGLVLPWDVPADPSFTGLHLLVQTVQQDAGAHFGWAFSRGLRLTVGS